MAIFNMIGWGTNGDVKITEGAFINLVNGYYYVNAGCTIEDFIGAITDLPITDNSWGVTIPMTMTKISDNSIHSFLKLGNGTVSQGTPTMIGSQLKLYNNGVLEPVFANKKIYILHK